MRNDPRRKNLRDGSNRLRGVRHLQSVVRAAARSDSMTALELIVARCVSLPNWEVWDMVLLEMSITPLGVGESVSQYVAECVDLVDRSGLDYELHAMGTIVEGELDQVLDLLRRCIEKTAEHSDRVTCAAKIDYRRGRTGRLKSKVTSVEKKLGRQLRKGHHE
jgi:uncharacterized protein (TIGR00106 family)